MKNPEINELITEIETLLEQLDFRMLTKHMERTDVMTPEEERRTFENYAAAGGAKKIQIRNDILKKNMKLVASIANRWWKRSRGKTGMEESSLFQEGIMGLVKAIERFSLKRGVKFSTFATPVVEGAIRDFLKPQFKKSKFEEPAERTARGKEGDEVVSKIDRFISQKALSPEETILGRISIKQLMKKLQPKEAEAIRLRYIEGLSLDLAGRRMNLSKERVSQYEKRALKKMKGMVR